MINRFRRVISIVLCMMTVMSMSISIAFAQGGADELEADIISAESMLEDVLAAEDPDDPEDPSGDINDDDYPLIVATDEFVTVPVAPGADKNSFRVKVPDEGYLIIANSNSEGEGIILRSDIFAGDITIDKNKNICIGSEAGIYSFTALTDSDESSIEVKYCSVIESPYGEDKESASALKSGKAANGLMLIGGGKQVHWYKFKNPKNQKIKLTAVQRTSSGGSDNASLKITVSGAKKSGKKSFRIDTGNKHSIISLYQTNNKGKLAKGTYYIKVEASNGCNGFYSLTWE